MTGSASVAAFRSSAGTRSPSAASTYRRPLLMTLAASPFFITPALGNLDLGPAQKQMPILV